MVKIIKKRFTLNRVGRERCILVNSFHIKIENEYVLHDGIIDNKTDELLDNQMDFREKLNALHEENKELQKELHLIHMSSMFSTVKSFKGDISKRYKYNEKTDMIYDTANHYGEYNKVLGKKEITMLLNEYNTLLEGSNEECF